MKQKPLMHTPVMAAIAGLALVTVASLSLAAPAPITETFDANINGWSVNYITGTGSVTWNPNMGWDPVGMVIGGGCLQVTLTNGGTKIGPLGTMPTPYPTSDYWRYEFDMMIDTASAMDGNSTHGNFQSVMRDATWSWDGHWIGGIETA